MTGQAKKTGRTPGALGEGSLTSRLLALNVGEYLLMPDVGNKPHHNYASTVKRARVQDTTGDWKLETCHGFTTGMDSVPFKFYRITRLK